MMLLLNVHAFVTLLMTGLIWFVQIVHYPLFKVVGPIEFPHYEKRHQTLTTSVVGPLMIIELACALLLVIVTWTSSLRVLSLVGAVLVAVIWTSTAFIQVPLHKALSNEFDSTQIDRLIFSNWFRTIPWSIRSILALALLHLASHA